MSFTHFEWIGHFDPADPYELALPIEPKAVRPLSPEAVERRIRDAPEPVGHMVHYSDAGIVTFRWTQPPFVEASTIEWFVRGLADDEDAMVMNQLRQIWYPEAARIEFEQNAAAVGERFRLWRESEVTDE